MRCILLGRYMYRINMYAREIGQKVNELRLCVTLHFIHDALDSETDGLSWRQATQSWFKLVVHLAAYLPKDKT